MKLGVDKIISLTLLLKLKHIHHIRQDCYNLHKTSWENNVSQLVLIK